MEGSPSENGLRREDRKAQRGLPIVPNRHAFNSFWDATGAPTKRKANLICVPAGVTRLTAAQNPPNNLGMAKPETVRRIKSYSAESGYVYQYQFQDAHPVQQGNARGNEYVYYVSADRKKMFPVRIFVGQDAIKKWGEATGRALTGTEEYAAAKMRLFQAFDEGQELSATSPALVVDESNLNALLQRLDL
jgi:hypothetical protein